MYDIDEQQAERREIADNKRSDNGPRGSRFERENIYIYITVQEIDFV